MSARVFNPVVMSEMRRMIGRSSSDSSGTPAAVARVRRDLFGPVNHEDAQLFVDRELAAIRNRESEKWGFDFVNETPLNNCRFRWERVTPEENIPQAYAFRRLSFLGQQSDSLTQTTKNASTNTATTASQETTSQKGKTASKQSQITDFLKCRKRSLSAGDISLRKVGNAGLGDISSRKVVSTTTTAPLSEPSARKRSRTRPSAVE